MSEEKNSPSQDLLFQALRGVIDRLEKTEKFVLSELPNVCEEMVREETFDCYVDLTTTISVILISATIALYTIFKFLSIYGAEGHNEGALIGLGIVAVISSIVTIASSCQITESVKAIYCVKKCQKLFLLRSLRKLVK